MNGKPQQTFQTDYILILKVELRMNGYVSDLILSKKPCYVCIKQFQTQGQK